MTWRRTQLGQELCDQDRIILGLFNNVPVKYIGPRNGFEKHLVLDNSSDHTVAIFNHSAWLSELIKLVQSLANTQSFYLGVNRYMLLGNDTNFKFDLHRPEGLQIIEFIGDLLPNFTIVKSGYMDNDQGRYYNFVQPLTWVYGNKFTD